MTLVSDPPRSGVCGVSDEPTPASGLVRVRCGCPRSRRSAGRVNLAAGLLPVVLLTVRGARSGVERTVPLVYFTDDDEVILIASSFGRPRYPAWYHNIKADPNVTLEAKGRRARFLAREVEGEDRERLYGLAKQLYTGYGNYEERTAGIRRVPVLRLAQL